ncbi:MAG: hypothetical protein M1834_006806 [Cirrosporium novae-zelandiae]|nr:MAG: hypothetical protein M1834_006806 [Cirrosporium novae-zelandiae]
MATDKSLHMLLRSLQTPTDLLDATRLLPSAITLLTVLTNPLNVTLLSSKLLAAPAIWDNLDFDGLTTCLKLLSVFNTASITIAQRADPTRSASFSYERGLSIDPWVRAVIKGADEHSPRWRHLLVIGGSLVGFEAPDRQALPPNLRKALESALVKATNLALDEAAAGDELAGQCLTLVLTHTFPLLSEWERRQLDYGTLLPTMIHAAFFSSGGLKAGYFVGGIDAEVIQTSDQKFRWAKSSNSFQQIQTLSSSPLLLNLGPVARLISHAAESAPNSSLLLTVVKDMFEFSRTIMVQWRQNKLSETDMSEEAMFLDPETVGTTLPVLWRVLKASMFATIIVLQAAMGRALGDPTLASSSNAPFIAMQILHTLRHLYFISSRLGHNAFSQYTFVFMTSVDILCHNHAVSQEFLEKIRPLQLGQIPEHPLDRCLDLFFLNTAEHFPLVLSSHVNEELLIAAAVPYLTTSGSPQLLPLFEAGHSVILAALSAPQCANLATKYVPFYIFALFKVFPQSLSPRQFRLAFRTLLSITAPPSALATTQPLLPSILLELVQQRALNASATPLPHPGFAQVPTTSTSSTSENDFLELSEQSTFILTILDVLPLLPLSTLEEWLPLAANLINHIKDTETRAMCRERFWEVISDGDMDVERAELCVRWWGTRGGREMVLFGAEDRQIQETIMSGGKAEVKSML